ncbi:hypothetical protein BGX26_002264 [Mortierella sp. AD094]|nr:hypothetical protein BGX26_002264 [Mortierella sp. AD094]
MLDPTLANTRKWLLFETVGGFFEAYRPVLIALQSCVPGTLPFGKYDLSVLLKNRKHFLDTRDQESIAKAVNALQVGSSLDDTQAKALVETLCREVALISGPPGTGKTKIGVDLMKVLLSNKNSMRGGPILCICYTNHALDQFLEHLLDKKITSIVRLGAQSKSERLKDYGLISKAKNDRKSSSVRDTIKRSKEEWKLLSAQIKELEKDIKSDCLPWVYVRAILEESNPNQHRQFERDTSRLDTPIFDDEDSNDDELDLEGDDFMRVGHKKHKTKSNYNRWVEGQDIKESALSDDLEETQEEVQLYDIPDKDRLLELLNEDIWDMSMKERKRLIESWRIKARRSMADNMKELLSLAERISQEKNEAFDDNCREVLWNVSVVGMTTNGAAKFQALLKSVAPTIIICEEAGEVLESHILSALSDSTQHLILIGDHLQLRPSVETYMLSSDSKNGDRYKLDMSLFERLVTHTKNPFPMSSLTIQRRMRPEISSLIRNTLYPNLKDGGKVLEYPSVCCMGQDLFFLDHAHPEDRKDKFGVHSFANTFEIRMVEALAHHLIKNGYDQKGDIAVLPPYLGQLTKLRDSLKNSFILTIDERDQLELSKKDEATEQDEPDESGAAAMALKKGEEAKIVIITLVRSNAKEDGEPAVTNSGSIGFLKSENRTNVLLSRAKHGMFLIGNASLMEKEKHGLWPKIIEELREYSRIGVGLPIFCKNHPHIKNLVATPEMLKAMSPDGGCSKLCNFDMPCGHTCPKFCKLNLERVE